MYLILPRLIIVVCKSRRRPCCFFFFFNDTATTEIYTLSLHDALPILSDAEMMRFMASCPLHSDGGGPPPSVETPLRSEEHTSELQSQSNLVCRLLLEKKKKKTDQER